MNRNKIEFSLKSTPLNNLKNVTNLHNKPHHTISESDSESDENNNKSDYRDIVNSAIFSAQTQQNTFNNTPEDSIVNDYDKYYEEKTLLESKNKKNQKEESQNPKYMNNIIKAVERNKMERNINKSKIDKIKLKRETGKDLSDIPVFVTKGYKEKMDQVNKGEDQQEDNTVYNKEFGMMGFYSNWWTNNKLYSNNTEATDKHLNLITDSVEDLEKLVEKRKKEYLKVINNGEINGTRNDGKNAKENEGPCKIKDEHEKKCETKEKEEGEIIIKKQDKLLTVDDYKSRYLARKKNRENVK